MSEHLIEDLVEDSVRTLDRHHAEDDDRVRDWLVALYAFQRTHDCSLTQGRVLDVLLRHRHSYRFPIAEIDDPGEDDPDDDDLDGLDDEYADDDFVYPEAGGARWRRLVDEGRLHGADAAPPRPVRLLDVVLAVSEAAERDGDRELIALWYALGPTTIMETLTPTVEEMDESPALRRLREIVGRTGALSVPLPDGYRPSDEDLAAWGEEAEVWWYRVT
ncbi:hypothetical protein [Catenuloplanes indicus]|uniref:Uncharacterized protein n=1 Tax=Catenuloplanes indicus TaxID=137267 RepID=A0AAE4B410_9ACTN|nr:hypothetical protein [Catenuloplanes indicus]MDQ0370818.1 hypothetical protein [Catenuloplanes indicus]